MKRGWLLVAQHPTLQKTGPRPKLHYKCAYILAFMYAHEGGRTHARVHACTYTYTRTRIHIHAHMRTHAHTRARIHTRKVCRETKRFFCIRTRVRNLCLWIYLSVQRSLEFSNIKSFENFPQFGRALTGISHSTLCPGLFFRCLDTSISPALLSCSSHQKV